MKTEEFMSLTMEEKLKTVNLMLEKEQSSHLKNVSEKLGLPYSHFLQTHARQWKLSLFPK